MYRKSQYLELFVGPFVVSLLSSFVPIYFPSSFLSSFPTSRSHSVEFAAKPKHFCIRSNSWKHKYIQRGELACK